MASVAQDRRASVAARIEKGYSPARHVALIVLATASVAVAAAWGLHRLTLGEVLLVPVAFVAANFGEWALHRYVLHRPTRLRVVYDRHARIHHVLYTHDAFAIHEARELRFVLMPWFSFLGMLAGIAPLVAALALAWSGDAARVFVLVMVGYYLVYEVCHTLYHLPPGAPVARWRAVQALARLHRTHHEPQRMREANFNVTFPIADAVLGTWRR